MSSTIFIKTNSKFKSLEKTQTLNAGTSELVSKKTRLKFVTLHSPFCLFLIKTL